MHHNISVITKLIKQYSGYHPPDHLVMLTFITLVCAVIFPLLRKIFKRENPGVIQQMLELLLITIRGSLKNIVGRKKGLEFLGITGTFTVVIFISNISGIIPGLQPPTANINITLGFALLSFFYYNMIGLREHGFLYIKHFLGPVWWLIPLILPVEIISHLARVMSLSVRLFGNIFGEHTASGRIFTLVPFAIPISMLALGIFGSAIQTLIFVVLTMVYIGGSVSEAH